MMGELFLYRGVTATELDQMSFTKMKFWHKFHGYENDRIEKENRRIRNKGKRYHPDA